MARTETRNEIVVIGAGLVGSILAVVLKKKGFDVTIFERYGNITEIPSLARSINLVMTRRGLKAAELLDLKKQSARQIEKEIDLADGSNRTGLKFDIDKSINLDTFNDLISAPSRCGTESTMTPASGDDVPARLTVTLGADVPILGADGGPSAVREALFNAGKLERTLDILEQGYTELIFPPDKNGDYCMRADGLHIWPRKTHMIMGLADRQKSFTGTLYMDKSAVPKTKEEVAEFFNEHYPSTVPLFGGIDSVAEQVLSKPLGMLGTVRCSKWNLGGRVCLIGDASHAIVPFFGQGMNSGFEDVVVIDKLFSKFDDKAILSAADFESVFTEFAKLRQPSCTAIADMALENFVEMRATVADETFLRHKKFEKALEQAFPEKFRSRYSMVCYGSCLEGNCSYENAFAMGLVIKDELLPAVDKLGLEPDSPELLKAGEKLIDEIITPKIKERGIDLSTMVQGDL